MYIFIQSPSTTRMRTHRLSSTKSRKEEEPAIVSKEKSCFPIVERSANELHTILLERYYCDMCEAPMYISQEQDYFYLSCSAPDCPFERYSSHKHFQTEVETLLNQFSKLMVLQNGMIELLRNK